MAKKLLILGAGFSASLGIPPTAKINEAISILLDADNPNNPTKLEDRVDNIGKQFGLSLAAKEDLTMTMRLLFDGNGAYKLSDALEDQEEAMKDYIDLYKSSFKSQANIPAFRHHINSIYQNYDLLSLRSTIFALQKSREAKFDLVQLLTTMFSAINNNISIPTAEVFPSEKHSTKAVYYNNRHRLEGALNVYKLIIYKIFKNILRDQLSTGNLRNYKQFFNELYSEHTSIDTLRLSNEPFSRKNYLSDLGIVSYNWDPILPFLSMKANHQINKQFLESCRDGICKKIYVDFGLPIPGIKLANDRFDKTVYSFSEDAAFIINEFTSDFQKKYKSLDCKSKILVKLAKLFFPHGLFNIRICPRCQNAFFVFQENMNTLSLSRLGSFMTSDPIPSKEDMNFVLNEKNFSKIRDKYRQGTPDELDCPLCEHPVSFEHSFLEIQSVLKQNKPWSVAKIQYDYGDFFSMAEHIIAIGYSFPHDDLTENIFLQTLRINKAIIRPKVTIIDFNDALQKRCAGWCSVEKVRTVIGNERDKFRTILNTMDAATQSFGELNIRLRFEGFPKVMKFTTLGEILTWKLPA